MVITAPMNRLLSIAAFVYGEQVCHEVFEPLVADLQTDVAENRSFAMRLRWWFAVASTFAICFPRATR